MGGNKYTLIEFITKEDSIEEFDHILPFLMRYGETECLCKHFFCDSAIFLGVGTLCYRL